MASSSSSASQRRRPLTKRHPLSRRNSSFLGSLKSLVTAPLAWFASTDDFEDSKDFQGKRRRLAGPPTEPIVGDDDRSARNKRMRIHSPPRDDPYSQPPASVHGYLDPPGSVFQPQQHRQSSPSIQPTSTRSLSVNQPYDFDNNNNHFRASTLSRTMSIDPPPRPLSSASAMASIPFNRDTSMESSQFMRATPRDMSMPPLSGRPSFLMRKSMTPQPRPLREVSEPPPLNTLSSRPTFLHAPPMKPSDSMPDVLSRQSSVTLGSLVDSVRSTRSPARQHSSLMFGGSNREHPSLSPNPETVIEKALHELDIYKTPLVPTRLRSSNIPASTSSSNLFKSRRASNLVLMQSDNRSDRLGRKSSGKNEAPVVNETKPYAGEGGMKKLLARRKQEADDENNDVLDEDQMDDDSQKRHGKSILRSETVAVPAPLPAHPQVERPSTTASSSTQSSSLRVGRTKARNHIARPARPQKMTFSAAFDEDAMDDGDELDEEAMQRKKELDALQEASKHVPVFKIPEGFSFAKEIEPVENDLSDAKEPPIKSLPFSLTKPAVALENPLPQQSNNSFSSITQSSGAPVSGTGFQLPFASPPSLTPPVPLRASSPLPQVQPAKTTAPAQAAASVTNTVPNFFANSPALSKPAEPKPRPTGVPNFFATSVLSKPLDLPPAAPLLFDVPSTTASILSVPLKDIENPLWEGESNKTTEPSSSGSSLFGAFGRNTSGGGFSTAVQSGSASLPASSDSNVKAAELTTAPFHSSMFDATPTATPTFSFSKPETSSARGGDETPKAQSLFGNSTASATPVPTFGAPAPSGLFAEPPKATIPGSGSSFRNSSSVSEPPKAPSSAPPSFTFGQSVASNTATVEPPKPLFGAVEAPKPLFGGGSGGFSFGNSESQEKEHKPASSPFSFGNTGTKETSQAPASNQFSFGNRGTKDAEPKPASNQFSFGNIGTKVTEPKPASLPFSFGAAPSTPPSDANRSSPFSFGPPATSTPAPVSLGFSFSGGGSNGSDVPAKPFNFGQSSSIARPSTPPKNQEQEVNMDESPTRDAQQTISLADRPTIGSNGFSFGNSTPTSAFGAQNNGSAPFSFGTSSTSPTNNSTFGKTAENNTNSFSFNQPGPSSTGFNFPQSKPDNEPPRPSTTGSFAFGTPTSATGPAPVFPFGGPGNNSTGSNFGQSQSGSAPGSPSTFAQQSSPFPSFGAPLPPLNSGFSFGSQPASPAGVNLSLPQPTTPGGFGSTTTSGFGQPQQPSSPFGAPSTAAPAPGGAALFTIGAPPAAPVPAGNRAIRKLPNRRGGAKR
ncbi:hypothetical protein DXG01_006602 [Tephrocybe rancida]|nr:hypothetical protein DXG01_006602 [Tephrocybe rancida]